MIRIKSKLAEECRPGCFLNIKIPSCGDDPFLRRPFSVAWVEPEDEILELLIQIRGRGTRVLSGIPLDSRLSILGPLGRGFPLEDIVSRGAVDLIGGGDGAAPLLFLSKWIMEHAPGVKIRFFLGAVNRISLPEPGKCSERIPAVFFSTDDGSFGFKGNVLQLYEQEEKQDGTICACGPAPLLEAVRKKSLETGRVCYLSLESKMACGFGVCNGCPVMLKSGIYGKVCTDGPVFRASEIAPLQV